jgi:hypothetical protein
MSRFLFGLVLLALAACKNKKTTTEEKTYTYNEFAASFKKATLPFTLTDTGFLKNTDTAAIRDKNFIALLQVNAVNEIFGKGAKVKFIPLWKIEGSAEEEYFIIKAQTNRKKAALLMVFDKDHQSKAGFSFLVPDAIAATMQTSSIDKGYSISKNIVKRTDGVMSEGKEVYVYDKAGKNFTLVMTDLLDEKDIQLVNPIDTLSRKHKLAGDYLKDKKNIVSIRDGRKPNLLTVFIHIEKGADCSGEIKGDATITSPTTAVYRQGGDPCMLQLNFSGSSVRLTELEACGSRRGVDCKFDGSFTRKKQPAAKSTKSTSKSSKN